jgi:hypothetical protein
LIELELVKDLIYFHFETNLFMEKIFLNLFQSLGKNEKLLGLGFRISADTEKLLNLEDLGNIIVSCLPNLEILNLELNKFDNEK